MAYRIFVSAALDKGGLDLLRQQPQFDVVVSEPLNGEALAKALAGADAVIVRSESKLTRQVLEHTRGLRVIGRAGSGVDNIDVEAATSRGIAVLNAPGGNTVTAAEHTLALMFALARHVPQANARLAQGVFDRKSFVGVELSGKPLTTRLDINEIFAAFRDNNREASTSRVKMVTTLLTFGVSRPETIANGQDKYYRLDVPSGGGA